MRLCITARRRTVAPRDTGLGRVSSFPNPVNEKAARTVAGSVLTLSVTTVALSLTPGRRWLWAYGLPAGGFSLAYSPARRSARSVTRHPGDRAAPGRAEALTGPPKRIAQPSGFVDTGEATLAAVLGHPLAQALLGLIIVAPGLESLFAICLGSIIFAQLMRTGLIPEEICAACDDVALRV